LTSGGVTFTDVDGTPGSYTTMLNGFDAPAGNAVLAVTGADGSAIFNL
jgi:hypothetical protein